MKFFRLYDNLEQYYDIDKRIHKPIWTKIANFLINTTVNTITKDIKNQICSCCAIDTHVHTEYSFCSFDSVENVLVKANKKGLMGICIMDHHTVMGYKKAVEIKDKLISEGKIRENFIVIPGIEYTTPEGHVGAMFVDRDIYFKSMPLKDVVKEIHNMGGLAICVHPYRKRTGIKDLCKNIDFDAVEYASGSILHKQYSDLNLKETVNLPFAKLGASDAHFSSFLGTCWTEFPKDTKTLEQVREAILNKKTIGHETENIYRLRRIFK